MPRPRVKTKSLFLEKRAGGPGLFFTVAIVGISRKVLENVKFYQESDTIPEKCIIFSGKLQQNFEKCEIIQFSD